MPSASDLTEDIGVLAKSTTENSLGEDVATYSVDRTERAEVSVRSGTERRFGGRPEEEAAVVVVMRKGAAEGVARDSRLRWRGDDLQVHARREIGQRDRFVELETTRTRE